jgi:hypothetical protein
MYVGLGRTVKPVSFAQQLAGYEYTETHGKFSARVSESIRRVLDSRCGKGVAETIFWNVSVTCNLGPADIADKPSVFIESLRRIFGEAAGVMEIAIVAELRKEFGLDLPYAPPEGEARENTGMEVPFKEERFVEILGRALKVSSEAMEQPSTA